MRSLTTGANAATAALSFDRDGAATFAGAVTVAGVGTFTTGLSTSGAMTFAAASGQVAGSLAKNATYGLTAYGVAGSSNDLTLLNASGSVVMANPTGTVTATFAGAVTITGNVGFYGQAATAKPTGVAVTAAAIHAALVTLNLIAA